MPEAASDTLETGEIGKKLDMHQHRTLNVLGQWTQSIMVPLSFLASDILMKSSKPNKQIQAERIGKEEG